MDLAPIVEKWAHYADAALIAVVGQMGMQGYYWAVDHPTHCTVNRVVGWVMVAAVLGMMTKAAAPDWFPVDVVIFGVGMFAMTVFVRLRVTMPAWIIRLTRGAGSPFDD